MKRLDQTLRTRLAELEQAHLRRELRRVESRLGPALVADSTPWVGFASNDYLGLADHPAVRAAAAASASQFGAGSAASRLVCGSLGIHHDLEAELARFKVAPAALSFASGYSTALGVIPALVGPGDVVILDRLAHACLVDGTRLSGAKLRVFRHNDPADLERRLRWATTYRASVASDSTRPRPEVLILTESVFSMDGDRAPLRELVELKDRYDAWLLVDEAHATGLIGPQRQGLIEESGVAGRVEVALGTLGKALGSAGGYVTGSRELVEYLVHRARSFVFSTAPTPAASGAALAAIRIVRSSEGATLSERLWSNIHTAHASLARLGWDLPPPQSPILPLLVGSEEDTLRLAAAVREEGLWIPAIRYPTVQRGRARLRISLSAAHSPADLEQLEGGLRNALAKTGITPPPP